MRIPGRNLLRSALCVALAATLVGSGRAAPVTTHAATGITSNSATLNGTFNPGGISSTGHFEYGTTASYGNTTASVGLGSGTADTNVSQVVTGLAGGVTYHFRADITRNSLILGGDDLTFYVPEPATVTTVAATSLHAGQATLNATVNPNKVPARYWFEHGSTTNYGSYTPTNVLGGGSTPIAVSSLITALPRGAVYHFRVVASNVAGVAAGTDMSFTVPQGPTGLGGATGGGQPFDIRQPALELNFIICTNGTFLGSGDRVAPVYLGEIKLFAGPSAPNGWAFCQGQLINIASNTSLFGLIGSIFGGDGQTNFALPDLRTRGAVSFSPPGSQENWYFGQKSGQASITLTVGELPAHTHSLPFPDSITGATGGGQPRPNLKPTLVLSCFIVSAGIYPLQGSVPIYEPFVGQIMLFAGNFALHNAAAANGQLLSISQNTAFYSVIGTNYGGDGTTTFGLPDLVGQLPIGTGQGPITAWSIGQQTGLEIVTMTPAQTPSHQHTVPSIGVTTGFTGGGQPQTLMQPSLAVQYLIATNGQIPSASVEATNTIIGEIQLYAGTNAPVGWLPCDGRVLNTTTSPALFGVISNFFGGDGVTTFALPNLCGRVPVGSTNGQPGAAYGAEQTVITVASLPAHTHTGPVPDYDRWITSFGLSGAMAAFDADADGDGSMNGYEWATGTNPTNGASSSLLTINSVGPSVIIGFPRNTNATDVIISLQNSANLDDANAWTGIVTNLAGAWNPPALVSETGTNNPVNANVSDFHTNHPAANYRLHIIWP